VSYVALGRFDVTIDGVTTRLTAGGSYLVAPNLVHGVVALEKGLLIDTFTPRRDEFLA
jgi:quercetin dioxygenase-like cupin family protein